MKVQGFTLIELVAVIVILGVLSVVALPKFIDLKRDAKIASLKSVYGSLKSGVSMAHSASLVKGMASKPYSGPNDSISVQGTPLGIHYLYPTTSGAFNRSVEKVLTDETMQYMIVHRTNPNEIKLRLEGYSIFDACRVVYQQATESALPEITIETNDC